MRQPHTLRLASWARLVGLALLLGVGVLASLGLASRTAHAQPAATITVSTCDESHLDSAISSAASGATITFGCSGTIPITSTLTISTNNLTLDGSGQSVTLDGNNSVEVLFVNSGVSFTLNALTIAHGAGAFDPNFGADVGGGLFNNRGTVNITNSTFSGNSAPGAGALGGGLFNFGGTVNISNSTFANNSAATEGGGLGNGAGTVSISNSTFANNSATFGNGAGGGLGNGAGTVSISNSTFANNSAFDTGGGLLNLGTVSISNSTFANNSASNTGGGLLNSGTLSISNSTFANNSAAFDGGGLLNTPMFGITLSISNSIVAHNSAAFDGNCYVGFGVSDQGYNLESGTDCGFTGTGSLQNTDPKLASTLASNGGPTQTLALLDGSPAIDRIPAANCPATDQRGATRPDASETTCDIGAYESGGAPSDSDLGLTNMPANITTNATSPQGAVVHYTPPTATDESGDSSTASVSCTPASGSTFAIGTTTVTCTATDSDDTNSPVSQSFTVTVKGAAAQVSDLTSLVNSFHLPADFQASFDTQLQAVQADLAANNTAQACQDLTAFSNHAQAQSGKGLTVSQANQLIAAAKQIQAVLGC